jgi:hypothetical protein
MTDTNNTQAVPTNPGPAPQAAPASPNAPAPAQTPAQSVAGQGGIGGNPNPQNLNRSPSPGGDGVQSSASERAAAGDTSPSQPAQQRINAAQRRENSSNPDRKPGERTSLIQSPGEVLPQDTVAEAMAASERSRLDAVQAAHDAQFGNPDEVSDQTRAEMDAGRAAVQRHSRRGSRPVAPAPADEKA